MLSPGTVLTVEIEKPAAGGAMIARHEGQVVLVRHAIPGERLRVRVTRVRPGVAYADPVEVIAASPDRRTDAGDWMCGGCVFAHIAYARQPALKAEIVRDALARIGGVSVDGAISVAAAREDGYRMRARLHVRKGRIGFFREATHQMCDPAPTRQLLPETLAVLGALGAVMRRVHAPAATDLELAENVPASERAVHLVLAPGSQPPRAGPLAAVGGLTGFSWSEAGGRGGRIAGQPWVTDIVAPASEGGVPIHLRHHVESFFQANRYLLSTLLTRVLACVPPGPVLDLYAGVGLFAVGLAARGERAVVAVEGDRHGAADLAINAAPYGDGVEVVHQSVERFLEDRRAAPEATVLIDPPRTGLSGGALQGILGRRPARIVYVSCDVATLARDVKRFTADGYAVAHVEAFDLFPNTAHVESLVVLQRSERAV
ncbi:MAG TPA: TRAM domain-containing protein [Vicinamibacterales bacterium]|nr:TRAM domain-containing protein [Vicinamibacterales bacterium]